MIFEASEASRADKIQSRRILAWLSIKKTGKMEFFSNLLKIPFIWALEELKEDKREPSRWCHTKLSEAALEIKG